MNPFQLSASTIAAIQLALSNNGTPGINNINYVTAYNDIYKDLLAQNALGNTVDAGTLLWFQQAAGVNEQQWIPSTQGTFIWAYTQAAAASEGQTISTTVLQNASNKIATTVFNQLTSNQYLFSDANIVNGFGTQEIISDDAGAGLGVIQAAYPSAGLDKAIWGGTLFATTELEDPTYFTDYKIQLIPKSRDAYAILNGLVAGSEAVLKAGGTITATGFANIPNLDLDAIAACLTSEQQTILTWGFVLGGSLVASVGALALGSISIYDAAAASLITLTSAAANPGVAYAYESSNNGLLTFEQGTAGTGDLALPDGAVINLGGSEDLKLTGISDQSGTPIDTLLNYLSQSGDPLTAAQLDQINYNYLNPTGSSYTLQGTVQQTSATAANYVFNTTGVNIAPGAVITGATTVTITNVVNGNNVQSQVTPTNILYAGGSLVSSSDISQDTITNIQKLDLLGGNVAMTNAQYLNDFTDIVGIGTITGSTAGVYDLNNANIDPTATLNLMASDWLGTTLIGNNQAGQILTASLYGDDILKAGDGVGDQLVAGGGVDTLIAGTGGDTFVATNGLAAGSIVQGSGIDTLETSGDITGVNISGIETLDVTGAITLTAAQFGSLTNVNALDETIYGSTAGIYDMSYAGTGIGAFTLIAGSNGGTSLYGDDGDFETLEASDTGNDTIVAGNGNNDTVIAGGGIDTIYTGTGSDLVVAAHGLAAGSSVFGGATAALNSATILETAGDISGATLSNITTLVVEGPSVTLTAAEMAQIQIFQHATSADNTIIAASAGTYSINGNLLGPDAFNLTAGSAGTITLFDNYVSNITMTAFSSGNDQLYSSGSQNDILNASGTSGFDYLYSNNSSGMDMTIANSTGNNDQVYSYNGTGNTLDAQGSTGNDTLYASSGTGNTLNATGSTGILTITAQTDTGDTIYAGNGADTILGGISSTIYSGSGLDTITGGTGSNTFNINGTLATGSTIAGNGNGDIFNVNGTLASGSTLYSDTSGSSDTFNISGTMAAGSTIIGRVSANNSFNISGTIASGANIIDEGNGTDVFNITGTLASGSRIEGAGYFSGQNGKNTFTLNDANTAGAVIFGSAGTNTFIVDGTLSAGTGLVGNGSGINTLETNGISTVNGGVVDISTANVQNIQTLDTNAISLNSNELGSEFNTINAQSGSTVLIEAAVAGTYSLIGKTTTGNITLEATNSLGTNLYGNDANNQTLIASATGNDTLSAGNGNGDVLQAGGGNDTIYAGNGTDTLIAGTGNDTFYGGSGADTYVFTQPSLTSQYTVVEGSGTSTIKFGPTVLASNVVASQSGNNLVLAISTDPITIQNYFAPGTVQSNIQFSNGTVWTPTIVNALVTTTFNAAQATLPTSPDNLGNAHVGGTLSGTLSVTNSAAVSTATAVSENLDASIASSTGNLTASGSFTGLAAGSTDSKDITLALNTATAGAKTGTTTLTLTSDSTGVPNDYRLSSSLPSQTETVTGNVYRYATDTIAALPTGTIVHVGDTVSQALTINNTAANDGYSENLTAAVTGTTGGLTTTGTSGEITAGSSSTGIKLGFSTTTAGTISGTATVALTSDGSTIDGLGTTSLGSQVLSYSATVNNYAKAAFEEVSGGGTFAASGSNYTLTYNETAGSAPVTFNLGVLNNVTGPSDLLSGSFTASTATGFTTAGLTSFSGLTAGQADTAPSITFNDATAGTYTETLTLASTGSNASGYSGALTPETLTITVNVAPATTGGQTYTLTTKADTVNGGTGNNTIVATNNALSTGDKINGGTGGTNTLALQGGGLFDLTAPTSLTNVQVVTAQEGQLGYKSGTTNVPTTEQAVYLRGGLNVTVNVASDTSVNSQDPNAPGIVIIGNNDADVINLGSGNDVVTLGSAKETVNGGSGNNTYIVTGTTLGANINGGTGSKNSLNIVGNGVETMGSNITGIKTVNLLGTGGITFTANTINGLAINGTQGSETITLQNNTQSYTAQDGAKHFIGNASAAGALIKVGTDTTSTLEIKGGGTAIMNTGDTGNLTSVKLDQATTLSLNNTQNVTVQGSAGADTIYAGTGGDTLTGNGGADLYFLNAKGTDVIKDTALDLNGTSIQNFSKLDKIDLTNLVFGSSDKLTYVQGATSGALTITDGTHSATLTLLGQYSAAGFHTAKDSAGTGTNITYSLATTTVAPPLAILSITPLA